MTSKKLFIAAFLMVAAMTRLQAQEPVTIDGYVTGGGQPIRGASVRIQELNLGATTDANGRYSLIVPSSRVRGQTVTLSARATRYQPRSVAVPLVGGAVRQDFELASSRTTGTDPIGTGALPARVVADERADSAALGAGFDLATSLTGRFPGLRVSTATSRGGSALLLSRGFRSINGTNNALVVLNGVPLEGTNYTSASQRFGFGGFDYGTAIQDINPSDILSVRLLQGAEATLRYGGRAANGVLEITSRNGRGLNGLEVVATHKFLLDSPLQLPAFQNQFGQGSNGQFSFFNGQGAGINDNVPESWGPELKGQPIPQASHTETRFGDVRYWLPRPDDVRDYFAEARSNITDASLVGGNERGEFRLSLRNVSSPILSPEASVGRRGIAASGSNQFTEKLRGGLHLSYIATAFDNLSGSGFDEANPMASLVRTPRSIDVTELRSHLRDSTDEQITWIYVGNRNNPWFAPLVNMNANDRAHVVAGADVDLAVTPWLNVSGAASTDRATDDRSFSVARGWLGGFATELGRSSFTSGGYQDQKITAHEDNLSAHLLAHPAARGSWKYTLGAGVGLRRNAADISTVAFDSARVAGDTMATRLALEGRSEIGSAYTLGLSGSASAAFRDVGTLTVGINHEKADFLPAANEARSYPSVLGQLNLRQMFPALRTRTTMADLRASWTRTSSDLTPYIVRSLYRGAQAPDDIALDTAASITRGATLQPEITSIAQGGFDVGVFGNRLSLALTLYNERTSGLVVATAPNVDGSVEATNAGVLSNRGVQGTLTVIPYSGGAFEWTTNASFTRNSSKVESLGDTTTRIAMGPSRFGVRLEAVKGQPFGSIVGTRFQRDAATGQLILSNGLPLREPMDTTVLGSMQPNWFGGVSNTLRYRNVELSFLVDGQFGGSVFSATNMWGSVYGTLSETGFRPDTGLVIPGVDSSGQVNTTHVSAEDYFHALGMIADRWVYSASFVKLRELRLGASFTVPNVAGLQNSRVEASLIGRNLAMWAKAPNIDPESVISSSSYQGFELGQPPRTRSFGVQITIVP